MPHPKFQLYKHVKISGKWRYCRAAIYSNGKVKLHVIVVGGQEEEHEEGSYCIRHKKSWVDVGTDPLAAQRMRYLADVRREDEAKKAVADADFVPKPRLRAMEA
jgi:hypothetical protein